MVRLTTYLLRVPVIKFRKGGKPGGGPAPAGTAAAPKFGSCPVGGGAPAAAQPAASMSTGASIPDIDLPARYRRVPLSDEEIDHVNGGGIHEQRKPKPPPDPQMLGVIKIPKGVLLKSGKNKKEVVSLNLVLQKGTQKYK